MNNHILVQIYILLTAMHKHKLISAFTCNNGDEKPGKKQIHMQFKIVWKQNKVIHKEQPETKDNMRQRLTPEKLNHNGLNRLRTNKTQLGANQQGTYEQKDYNGLHTKQEVTNLVSISNIDGYMTLPS